MFSFEGKFRREPSQSLGGTSKHLVSAKAELLAKAQEKRNEREQRRLENASALCIQSTYRSYCVRKAEYAKERENFTRMLNAALHAKPTTAVISGLYKSLTFFLMPAVDDDCLLQFSSACIKWKDTVKDYMQSSGNTGFFHMKKWLVSCLGLLRRLTAAGQTVNVPLRVLEIFLDGSMFIGRVPDELDERLTAIYQVMCVKGYYQVLRLLCDNKIPASLEKGPSAPTPLAESLLALIVKPFISCSNAPITYRYRIMQIIRSFCASFMSPAYTHQIHKYVLPALSQHASLPIAHLLTALTSGETDIAVESTAYLLHAVMSLSAEHIGMFSEESVRNYLQLIATLFSTLVTRSTHCFYKDDDDDDDEMDCFESSSMEDVISFADIRKECLEILNSPGHIKRLVLLLSKDTQSDSMTNVCQLCHLMMSKLNVSVHTTGFLYSLAFNTSFMRRLWMECLSLSIRGAAGNPIALIQMLSRGNEEMNVNCLTQLVPCLSLFSSTFYHSVLTLHDDDFHRRQTQPGNANSANPFSTEELVAMVAILRDACLGIIKLAVPESKPVFDERRQYLEQIGIPVSGQLNVSKEEYNRQRSEWVYLFKVMARLIKHLYSRDTRTQFCPKNHWLSSQMPVVAQELRPLYQNRVLVFEKHPLTDIEEEDDGLMLSVHDRRKLTILTELPFVVPFEERVMIFQNLVSHDKLDYQTDIDGYGPRAQAPINISVRRDYLYEDAYDKLSLENEPSVKPKIRVQLRNATGLDEIGIDGGGIFREFLSELLRTGFDPNRGLFKYTSTDRLLYPNPEAPLLLENYRTHFFFLGRMLGKALYENMLVELPFASFFLSKILGKSESSVHQLASLDTELYKNLLSVKSYGGDVLDLGLDFSVVNNVLGITEQVELKPNGKNILVDNDNCIEYIHLMADYKLNKQIRSQCIAFTEGLEDVFKLEWLKMFNHHELQILISGATSPIDVDDLRKNTKYSGSFDEDHPTIQMFWKVVKSFTNQQRSALLKFVTSCSRPPLLGFKDLYPAFCIHHGGDEERLPTASTCMNFLKLPAFKSEETLRSKLLYAIESGSGFELS